MAISKVASHRLLSCVPTLYLLYVYMSKCCFINVKSKHEEKLIFDQTESIPQAVKTFQNPRNPYCTIPVSSFMMNDDSHINIIFPIIHYCARNKCCF